MTSVSNTTMNSKMPCDCDICCEPFTKQVRKAIRCGNCELIACASCVKQYLLSQKTNHCMGCKVGWTDAFCSKELGGFMHGQYRKYTKELLWDMEKARMPETMPAVERTLKLRKMREEAKEMEKQIEEARRVYENLRNMQHTLRRNIEMGNVDGSSKEEMESKKKQFTRACPVDGCAGFLSSQWKCGVCETWTCKDCLEVIGKDKEAEHTCNPDVLASAQLLKKETKPCPSCSAAIYKISGCDQMWCTQCKIPFSWRTGLKVSGTIHNPHFYEWQRKNQGNVQNPGAVMCGGIPTWGMFSNIVNKIRFTNPDVNRCAIRYMRIYYQNNNGYSAYLSSIKGASRWTARESCLDQIVSRYRQIPIRVADVSPNGVKEEAWFYCYNHRKENNRERYEIPLEKVMLKDNPNGDESIIDIRIPSLAIDIWHLCETLREKHRGCTHFQHVELDGYRRRVNRHTNDHESERVSYILKELSEEQFKSKLIKEDRKQKKERAILDIFEVYNNVIGDCCRTMYNGRNGDNVFTVIKRELVKMEQVRLYCNCELMKLSKTYQQCVPIIGFDCYTVSHSYKYYSDAWRKRDMDEELTKELLNEADKHYRVTLKNKLPEFIKKDEYAFKAPDELDMIVFGRYMEGLEYRRRGRF